MGECPSLEEGKLDRHLTQCGQAEAYLLAKFHLDQSNRLANNVTDTQDRQRSDGIGRTLLQTVDQKRRHSNYNAN